jgi:hypothetical protein
MKHCYKPHRFTKVALNQLHTLNSIIQEYKDQGFVMTVRQLFYQMVARDYIPNTERSYKSIIHLVAKGRMSGLIDWDAIEDRTREFIRNSHWESPGHIVRAVANQYDQDRWVEQDYRVFLVVEKEALVSVFERPCRTYGVPLLAARGYPSISVIREFAEEDIIPALSAGQQCILLHFGDHDPSGIDMSRDLVDRITDFVGDDESAWTLERCALNMDQIRSQNPPANPAKKTDKRFEIYYRKFNTQSSWELDALSPTFLSNLAEEQIKQYIDFEKWNDTIEEVQKCRERLSKVAEKLDQGKL